MRGAVDALLMRVVDVLYGLPYILLVILMRVALVPLVAGMVDAMWANFLVLLVGIGAVSWLTLARVVRGQVMSCGSSRLWRRRGRWGLEGRGYWGGIFCRPGGDDCGVWDADGAGGGAVGEFSVVFGIGDSAAAAVVGESGGGWMEALNPVLVRWWLIAWPCAG